MFLGGRTTRSKRRLAEQDEGLLSHEPPSAKYPHLSDHTILTPPPSQLPDEGRKTRRGRASIRQPPYLDNSPMKTRHGASGSLDASGSSTSSSEPSLTAFQTDYMSLDYGLDWPNIGGLASENDPFLHKASGDSTDSTSVSRSRDINTPPMSPDMLNSSDGATPLNRPDTPTIRPETPGDMGNPLTPMDGSLVSSTMDATSLVETSSLIGYGPPPTPMCPPTRVGNISSSSSSLCSKLPLCSTSTPNNAAPPHNILDSGEDTDDNDLNNDISKGQSLVDDNDNDDDNNTGTHPPTYINNNTTSPDIVSEPSVMLAASGASPSPPSPDSTLSKHSHRLRIIAFASSPPPRSCPQSSSKSKGEQAKVRTAQAVVPVTKPILKSRTPCTSSSDIGGSEPRKLKLNFLSKPKTAKKVSYSEDVQGGDDTDTGGCHVSTSTTSSDPPSFKISIAASFRTLNRLSYHDTPSTSSAKASGEQRKLAHALGATSATNSCRFQPTPQLKLRDDIQLQDGCFRFLRLRNFMTHKDLTCEWKKNIVFIHGQNGSGKSAILTACQLLVGYKAANTNRTTSVTGFIKKGCKYAIIEGGLTNYNGSVSIDKYGEVITLSRRINLGGGSTYKIGTPGENHPRIVHLQELTDLRQALQIDPNNPIQFLQQEQLHRSSNNSSKTGSGRGKKDFQMLKDATQLTEQERMLQDADDNFKEAKHQIVNKKDHRNFLVLQEKQLKEQCDLVHRIEESESSLQHLKNEQKWAEVKILEEELIKIKSRKEETFLEIKNLKEERKKLEDEAASFISMKDKAKKMIASIRKELNQFSNDKEAKINELREVNKTLHRVQNEHTLIIKAIKGYTRKIAELEASLNEDTMSYEEQNQVYEAEIQRCLHLIPQREEALEKLREKRDNIVTEFNEFKVREREGKEKLKKMETELNQAKKELIKKDNFGIGMKELLQDKIPKIKWKVAPVGPLGAYICVKDERYAPLIEHILGHSTLFSFVVQTTDDFKTLRSLIADVYHDKRGKGREPTVIQISAINPIEYMKKLRHTEDKLSGYKTVLSLLSIKDYTAKIGVIEQRSCERIVLFDDFKAAAAVMKEEGKAPGELVSAYTLQWYRVTPYPRYQFQPVNAIKRHTEIIPMARASTTIHIQEEIAREREVLETCRKSLKGYKELGAHRPGLEQMLRTIDEEIQAINKEINQLNNKIKHAKSMIKDSPAEGQDKNIQNQIKAEQDMRAEQEMKIQVRLQEIELAKQEITRIANEKDIVDEKMDEGQHKSSDLEGEYGNALGTISKIEKSRDGYSVKIERLEKEFHQLSLQETKVFEDLNEKMKQAVDAGERPKILDRSPNEIRRETEELEVFLTNNNNIVLSKKRITLEYMNSKALVKTITSEINVVDKLLYKYQRYLKMGQDVVVGLKLNIANLLEANFQTYTELHNLTGKLMVLWDKEMLIYYVSPDQHSDARARQSISVAEGGVVKADKQGMQNYCSNLSGGERAKAQIFFIMSMWEITDLPCHFVDEFETFMDEPSRIQIQRLLIKHAKKHPEKQFFFFTPQILAGVPTNDPSIYIMFLKKKVKNGETDGETRAIKNN